MVNPSGPERWLTTPEAAARLGVKPQSLYAYVARGVIDTLKDGRLLFAYYPDQRWLKQSAFLQCAGNQAARQAPVSNTRAAGAP